MHTGEKSSGPGVWRLNLGRGGGKNTPEATLALSLPKNGPHPCISPRLRCFEQKNNQQVWWMVRVWDGESDLEYAVHIVTNQL